MFEAFTLEENHGKFAEPVTPFKNQYVVIINLSLINWHKQNGIKENWVQMTDRLAAACRI